MTAKIRTRRLARYAGRHRPRGGRAVWLLHRATRAIPALTLMAVLVVAAIVSVDTAAWAAPSSGPAVLAADSVEEVVNNLRGWLVGILVAVATLFLTVGGVRYMIADGDPGEVEKAKSALKSAVLGYMLAMLAPLFVSIVGKWVA